MNKEMLIIMCVCFLSCSDFEKDNQGARVDSLIGQVEGIEKAFLKIQIDSIPDLQMSTYEVERQNKTELLTGLNKPCAWKKNE